MVKKSKLLTALDAHKGRDYEAEKRKKQLKAAERRKRQKAENETESADDQVANGAITAQTTAENEFASFSGNSEDEVEVENGIDKQPKNGVALQAVTEANNDVEETSDSEDEVEDDSDVALSDLEAEDLEDTIPHHRLTINNGPALLASRNRVSIIKHPKTPFHYHNSLISALPSISFSVSDPNDDLTRELEFYRVARDAAVEARTLLKKEKIPFSRPNDYFAEMVKTDEHMGQVKKKLYDEAAAKKASQDARKLRDAKKFGKAVQVAKEQERAKERRSALDKIQELKRKRKGTDTGLVREDPDADLFETVTVENSTPSTRPGRQDNYSSAKRQKRDQKHGFGGKKRFSKSGDAISSSDMSGFSEKRMKARGGGSSGMRGRGGIRRGGGSSRGGGSQRPGKNRRAAMR